MKSGDEDNVTLATVWKHISPTTARLIQQAIERQAALAQARKLPWESVEQDDPRLAKILRAAEKAGWWAMSEERLKSFCLRSAKLADPKDAEELAAKAMKLLAEFKKGLGEGVRECNDCGKGFISQTMEATCPQCGSQDIGYDVPPNDPALGRPHYHVGQYLWESATHMRHEVEGQKYLLAEFAFMTGSVFKTGDKVRLRGTNAVGIVKVKDSGRNKEDPSDDSYVVAFNSGDKKVPVSKLELDVEEPPSGWAGLARLVGKRAKALVTGAAESVESWVPVQVVKHDDPELGTWGFDYGQDEAISPVAQTILDQIGRKALFMIGAHGLVAGKDSLSFRVGRNGLKTCNAVMVQLMPDDTYTLTFLYASMKAPPKELKKVEDVYAEDLVQIIGRTLGMATSLPKITFKSPGATEASETRSYYDGAKLQQHTVVKRA